MAICIELDQLQSQTFRCLIRVPWRIVIFSPPFHNLRTCTNKKVNERINDRKISMICCRRYKPYWLEQRRTNIISKPRVTHLLFHFIFLDWLLSEWRVWDLDHFRGHKQKFANFPWSLENLCVLAGGNECYWRSPHARIISISVRKL